MKKLTFNTALLITTFLCTCMLLALINSRIASAAYNNMPGVLPQEVTYTTPDNNMSYTTGQYINLVTVPQNANSGYGATIPNSYLKVYSTSNDARTFSIDIVPRRAGETAACRNYFIEQHFHSLDSNENYSAMDAHTGWFRVTRCTGEGGYVTYSYTLPAGMLTASNVPGHEGLYVGMLELRLVDEVGYGNHTGTLKVQIDSGGKIGFAAGAHATIYPSLNRPFGNVISTKFRPPCGTSGAATVWWEDDDYFSPSPNPPGSPDGDGNGTISQYNDPLAMIYEYNYAGTFIGHANARYLQYGDDGRIEFDYRPGYKYELRMNSVDGGNGISIAYPWDSGDFYIPCPAWNISDNGSTEVRSWTEIGDSSTFIHKITWEGNATPDPQRGVSYRYDPGNINAGDRGTWADDSTVQAGTIGPSVWTVPDAPNSVLSPGSGITNLSKVYCQRYYVDPAQIDNGAVLRPKTYGNEACTTVVGGKTSAQAHRPGGGDELAENGDSVQFAPGLDTQNYTTSGGWGGYTIDCSWKLTRQPPAAGTVDIAGAGNSGSCDGTITASGPTNFAATTFVVPNTAEYPIGTKVCIEVRISSATSISRSQPNSAFIDNPTTSSCYTVSAKPIVRTYVGDVIAGGRFGQNGTAGEGKINANTKAGFLYAGSGVEFAAIAASQITGFSSATMRTLGGSSPLPGTGLTFSNNSPTSLGSYFSSNSREVKDWFVGTMEGTTRDAPQTTPGPSINNAGFAAYADGGQTYFAPSANKTLTISAISNFTQSHTVYVDGDVIITGNIVANEASIVTGGGDVGSIPYFTVIAKGNIYISKDVTRLDGLYIAQPKDVSGGKNNDKDSGIIYTCKDPTDGASYSTANLYYSCDSKLTINGAFVSQKTKFLRTNGTLAQIAKTEDAVDPIGTPGINSGGWSWLGTTPDLNAAGCNDAGVKKVQLKVEHDLNWSNGDNYFCYKSDYELHFVDGDKLGAPASILSSLAANCASFNNTDANTGDVHSSVWSKAYLCAFTPPVVPLVSTPVDVGFEVLYGSTACSPGKEGVGIRESEWNPPGSESNRNPWGPGKVLLCYFPDRITTPGIPEKYEQLKFGDGKIAEAFRLSPEFYLGNPAFKPRSDRSDGNGEYDSILTLPPIL